MRRLYSSTYKRGKGFTGRLVERGFPRRGRPNHLRSSRRYVMAARPSVDSVLSLAGLRSQSDTTREPRLESQPAQRRWCVDHSALADRRQRRQVRARATIRLDRRRDNSNDESFDVPDAMPAQPWQRSPGGARGGETITLQLPVRLVTRVQSRCLPIPNATEKAARIRAGILRGSTS